MEGWSEGKIVQRTVWDEGLATLRIEADTQPFRAGQFFNLGLHVGTEFVRRSYSAASAPGQPLEFFLSQVPAGSLSPPLLDLEVGDKVFVERRPLGFFTLEKVSTTRDLWLVATGTGLGPFIAMLRTGDPWERFERVIVVQGVRHRRHLAYAEELQRLTLEHPGRFNWLPVVSRPEEATSFSSLACIEGRVTTALVRGALEDRATVTLSPEHSHVLLCGNPAMIEEMVPLLIGRGLKRNKSKDPGQISFEKYW